MIKRKNDFRLEKRPIAGGDGEIIFHHRVEKEDMYDKARLCAELIIEPGCGIGQHAHTGEVEIFYVLEGELVSVNPDGSREAFHKGDVMVTGGGDSHGLRNESDAPAVMLAVIAV